MVKVEVTKEFTLKDFLKLKNIVRKNIANNEEGKLYLEDTFECDDQMAEYLTGNNQIKQVVVRIVEVIPEEKPIVKAELKKPVKKKK